MRPYTTAYIGVLILLHMCPHTTAYMCVLILLHTHTCAPTPLHISVDILLGACAFASDALPLALQQGPLLENARYKLLYMCPHYSLCRRMLLYIYIHISVYVASCSTLPICRVHYAVERRVLGRVAGVTSVARDCLFESMRASHMSV